MIVTTTFSFFNIEFYTIFFFFERECEQGRVEEGREGERISFRLLTQHRAQHRLDLTTVRS